MNSLLACNIRTFDFSPPTITDILLQISPPCLYAHHHGRSSVKKSTASPTPTTTACAPPCFTTPLGMDSIRRWIAQQILELKGPVTIHNKSKRPIALIPISVPNGTCPSLGKVRNDLVRMIPAEGSDRVPTKDYDLSGININSQIWIHFRAGNEGEDVQVFEKRLLNGQYLSGFDVKTALRLLHYQLTDDMRLNCDEAGRVTREDGNAGQPKHQAAVPQQLQARLPAAVPQQVERQVAVPQQLQAARQAAVPQQPQAKHQAAVHQQPQAKHQAAVHQQVGPNNV